MVAPRIDIVMTTIGNGRAFLEAYSKLAGDYSAERVRIIIIVDRKTPATLFDACHSARMKGLRIISPSLAEQDQLLARLGAPQLVPYDTDNRRNIGYLIAWMSSADIVISVDDDNLPLSADFLNEHAIVASGAHSARMVSDPSGWWDPCAMLAVTPIQVYSRGFPFAARDVVGVPVERAATADVRVNAGLWLGDPDVDAITRLAVHPKASAVTRVEAVLGADTWSPVNSQNTALHAEALPAYYFPRMGYRLGDQRFDRYADIFSGYFLQACCKHLGHAVRIGTPIVNHQRNMHSLLRDLREEMYPLTLLEDLLPWLRECRLEGTTYAEAYQSLSFHLHEAAESMNGAVWTDQVRGFLHQMAHLMRQWLVVLERAGRGNPE
jgi:Reversibly glycosylated polypeptide